MVILWERVSFNDLQPLMQFVFGFLQSSLSCLFVDPWICSWSYICLVLIILEWFLWYNEIVTLYVKLFCRSSLQQVWVILADSSIFSPSSFKSMQLLSWFTRHSWNSLVPYLLYIVRLFQKLCCINATLCQCHSVINYLFC